jgi:hypothetical protein
MLTTAGKRAMSFKNKIQFVYLFDRSISWEEISVDEISDFPNSENVIVDVPFNIPIRSPNFYQSHSDGENCYHLICLHHNLFIMLNVLAQISFKIDYNFETFLKCTNAEWNDN